MRTILLAEDEAAIARVLSAYLKRAGFDVRHAADGEQALLLFDELSPDLVLLDVMMPAVDGWIVLERIRQRSSCPIIMLTAKGDVADRLEGLNRGADDYMSKPFVPEEVVARVNAVLRRPIRWIQGSEMRYFGNLTVDFAARRVCLNGAELLLSPRDLSLLLFLAEYPNRMFTREQLIEQVWGIDYEGSDRAVDLSIKRLRQALSHWPLAEGEIRTLRGTGYQFWVGE
ncbi:response regulator transcription factor [Paenibacillus hemerocallicola]|jgi:DNA-binding response OmpR family regulator|uniref:Response regulator transcription factor n=1 Tax=Paenibacillus hemerocallicola TaxID=1172614 RepID=A0A5C4SXI6_9BACL|nr:response regulator transcription factor [Paenibacillus hemerocallicola]TNJ60481.1 response regulator transcription factor [Paenibacillus hemerocallicola]